MTDQTTLELIQKDIRSIKSQIDVLRMETKAHSLETVAYLLDLALQETKKSELPGYDGKQSVFRPVVLQ